MIKEIARNYSKLLAEIRCLIIRCDCDNPHTFVDYKFINPQSNMWEYNIICSYCGKIHHKSEKK